MLDSGKEEEKKKGQKECWRVEKGLLESRGRVIL